MNEYSAIRYLVLFITGKCNLRCRYCYAKNLAPLGEMSFETAVAAINQAALSGRSFHVQLTGGEPTIEPKMIEQIAAYIHSLNAHASIAVQTNGTLLDADMARLFLRYRIQVGISIDGMAEIHDRQRGSFNATLRGLRTLEKYNVPCRVTSVVTEMNVLHLERLALMLAGFSNIRGIALDLLVKKGNAVTNHVAAATPDMVRCGVGALSTMLDIINYRRTVPIQLREQEITGSHVGATCHAVKGESLAVLPNSRVYPCSQTAGDSAFDCGTVENIKWKSLRMPVHGADCPSRTHYNQGHNLPLHDAVKSSVVSDVDQRNTK